MSSYITASPAAHDGSAVHNHPDLGAGLGIGIAQTPLPRGHAGGEDLAGRQVLFGAG